MKKIVLTGLFIAASLSFAATATDIERQAAAIDQQIQVIENRTIIDNFEKLSAARAAYAQ